MRDQQHVDARIQRFALRLALATLATAAATFVASAAGQPTLESIDDGHPAQNPWHSGARDLGGTAWQLVIFQSSGDENLIPDDRAKYTIDFGTDGRLSARIDCSLGHSTWTSPGPSQLHFGTLVFADDECASGTLHDQIVKDWTHIELYVIKNGRLFLSAMGDDGSLYAFEPIGGRRPASTSAPGAFAAPAY